MPSIEYDHFCEEIFNAFDHLYDRAFLRQSPLIALFFSQKHTQKHEQDLHNLLIRAISELKPPTGSPVTSREWRRHRLLQLRYIDGLEPQAIADMLAISRRHYYREHKDALVAIAEILWNNLEQQAESASDSPNTTDYPTRLGLVRHEAATLTAHDQTDSCQLDEVVTGVISLVHAMADRQAIVIEVLLPENLPALRVSAAMLRQILVGILNHLIARVEDSVIQLTTKQRSGLLTLNIRCTSPASKRMDMHPLALIEELATINHVDLIYRTEIHDRIEVQLGILTVSQRTVLIVEDNPEMSRLLQSYLSKHDYRSITAQDGSQAIQLARDTQPFAITLDVMIPEADGWSVLQTLRHQIETRDIPIIVCTVLGMRELALSLGASAFLEKPITEQDLITALDALG